MVTRNVEIKQWFKTQTMPLFNNKFSPKKAPLRQINRNVSYDNLEELVGEGRTIKLSLGEQKLLFQNGEWVPNSGRSSSIHKLNQKLKKTNNELKEEINLLKLKYEILLNMMTEMTAKAHAHDRAFDELKQMTQ